MAAHTQQEEEASLTSSSPVGAGREDIVGMVKEKTRVCLLAKKKIEKEVKEEEEGGWDWLVVVGRFSFHAGTSA